MNPPNLLFVFADQMRGMDMGCAGNPDVQTPTLDAFARTSTRLTRAYATCPVCGPNRATLLTGRYPISHHVIGNDLPLPEEVPSLGSILKASGYETGYIGKWHLDGVPRSKWTPPGARRHGFDFWASYNCTHDYLHPKYYRDTPDLIQQNGYEPEVQTDLALEFLTAQSPEKPFALVLSWGPPHDPYDAVPEGFRSRYDASTLKLRPNVQEYSDNPLAAGRNCRTSSADYYAAITALDAQFARLLEAVEANGQAENTIVVFTSDHGDMLWSHGLMQKQLPYEEATHIPFVVRRPAGLDAGICDALMGTVSTVPTLLGLMGIEVPAGVQGTDLSTQLRDRKSHSSSSVFLANYIINDQALAQDVPEWRGVRTKRYTYVETLNRVPWLLFDNACDPYQEHNLIESQAHHDLRHTLQDELRTWLDRTNDDFKSGLELINELGLDAEWQAREREAAHHWKSE